ncbi:hypothetical protein [Achromobacter phage Motura]|uniref:Uncharacterized protein n=1 Tax=Achromobacter phage Motura TaxID=2591403 RepID=A0A514CT82_9CAUD|nr:hypothetical protein H1O15_gp264 [Achromobacter phage Motura]QDH83697.1 hypothetical protein [Achromobacter phage Motura]
MKPCELIVYNGHQWGRLASAIRYIQMPDTTGEGPDIWERVLPTNLMFEAHYVRIVGNDKPIKNKGSYVEPDYVMELPLAVAEEEDLGGFTGFRAVRFFAEHDDYFFVLGAPKLQTLDQKTIWIGDRTHTLRLLRKVYHEGAHYIVRLEQDDQGAARYTLFNGLTDIQTARSIFNNAKKLHQPETA